MTALRDDLVLHVGLPAAGTAVLQSAFALLHEQLRQRDVTCAAGRRGRGTALRVCVLDWDDLPDLRRAEEHVRALIAGARATRVHVALHAQRQDLALEAAYLAEVGEGATGTPESWFPDPVRAASVLDYGAVAERLAGIGSVTAVSLHPVEPITAGAPAFVDDALACIGLRGALDLGALGALGPVGHYSELGLSLALALNPLQETPDEQARLARFLGASFGSDEQLRMLSDDARLAVLEAHASPNAALLRRYRADLPDDCYADDAGTSLLRTLLPPIPIAAPRPPSAARRVVRRVRRSARRLHRV